MSFVNTSPAINPDPKTPAQLRAALNQLAENINELNPPDEFLDLVPQIKSLLEFSHRFAEADSALSPGDVLYSPSEDHIDLADASDISTADVVGVAISGAVAGETIPYTALGVVTIEDWGLTPGTQYFLDAATPGGLVTTPVDATGNVAIIVGLAHTPEKLLVNPQQAVIL